MIIEQKFGLMMARGLEENGPKVYIIDQRLATLEMAATQAVSVILTTRTKHFLVTTKKEGHIIPLRGDVAKKETWHELNSSPRKTALSTSSLPILNRRSKLRRH